MLSRAITLVESQRDEDQRRAADLIHLCLPHAGASRRIGITGVPGVGKSTFIDAFGSMLIESGSRVAVLAVDPSSARSGGSILGDKTRMERLSVSDKAFVRPSPTAATLGGVAKRTRESIILCEAAGYDVILVETVGVGQSETAVHSMTDMFVLLKLANAGDELQGIKRGIMELADIVAINKAEGDDLSVHRRAMTDCRNALHLMPAKEGGWLPKVEMVSSLKGFNLDKVIAQVDEYFDTMERTGQLNASRERQNVDWFRSALAAYIHERYYAHEGRRERVISLEQEVASGQKDPYAAIAQLRLTDGDDREL